MRQGSEEKWFLWIFYFKRAEAPKTCSVLHTSARPRKHCTQAHDGPAYVGAVLAQAGDLAERFPHVLNRKDQNPHGVAHCFERRQNFEKGKEW